MTEIKALSIRQPWSHAIIHLGKDIENRGRAHGYRGPLLIHASAGCTLDEYLLAEKFMIDGGVHGKGLPDFRDIERGGIVGIADVTGCVDQSDSPWWMGPCGLVLANARPLPFTPCRGTIAPLFWQPPVEVLEKLRPHFAHNA